MLTATQGWLSIVFVGGDNASGKAISFGDFILSVLTTSGVTPTHAEQARRDVVEDVVAALVARNQVRIEICLGSTVKVFVDGGLSATVILD